MEKRVMILIAVLGIAIALQAQTAPQSIIDSKISETYQNQNQTGPGATAEPLPKKSAKQDSTKDQAAPSKLKKQGQVSGQVDLSLLSGTLAGQQVRGRIRSLRTIFN